jgi:hypothetical protein
MADHVELFSKIFLVHFQQQLTHLSRTSGNINNCQTMRELRIHTKNSRTCVDITGCGGCSRSNEACVDDLFIRVNDNELSMRERAVVDSLTDGSDLIPAREIAITNGEAAAVPCAEARFNPGESDGTRRPITAVPRI